MSLVILNTLRTRLCRISCEKRYLWPHLRVKASLSTHELPRAKWLPFFKVACKDFVTTRYAWFIAGPWHGMYDLLPVHLVNDVVVITQNWCECTAGKSGCSHSIGLLYLLVHFHRTNLETVSEVQSKTSLPRTWHLLRKGRFLDTNRNVVNYTRKYAIKHSVSLDIELFLTVFKGIMWTVWFFSNIMYTK